MKAVCIPVLVILIASISISSGAVFCKEKNTYIEGKSMWAGPASVQKDCAGKCRTDKACVAFTYTGGYCWLYEESGIDAVKPTPELWGNGVKSGFRIPSNHCTSL